MLAIWLAATMEFATNGNGNCMGANWNPNSTRWNRSSDFMTTNKQASKVVALNAIVQLPSIAFASCKLQVASNLQATSKQQQHLLSSNSDGLGTTSNFNRGIAIEIACCWQFCCFNLLPAALASKYGHQEANSSQISCKLMVSSGQLHTPKPAHSAETGNRELLLLLLCLNSKAWFIARYCKSCTFGNRHKRERTSERVNAIAAFAAAAPLNNT